MLFNREHLSPSTMLAACMQAHLVYTIPIVLNSVHQALTRFPSLTIQSPMCGLHISPHTSSPNPNIYPLRSPNAPQTTLERYRKLNPLHKYKNTPPSGSANFHHMPYSINTSIPRQRPRISHRVLRQGLPTTRLS